MARKKFYNNQEAKTDDNKNNWKIAKYIRLSRYDGDNLESYSVSNQRKLLDDYIEDNEEFTLSFEFIDDDYTGTNFERPGFQRMMKEIELGNINCIIVKDLSRFARNYIEAGRFLEEVLPSYNCRVISIIDGVDSFKNPDAATGIMVRFKNLMHDQTSQDTSRKVRETKDMLRRNGKNISPPPFGYIRDPEDKYKMKVDNEAAEIVRMIFDMYLSGIGFVRIAQKLNSLGILTKSEYKRTGSLYSSDDTYQSKGWRANEVRKIIVNKTYMGSLDQKRTTTRNYKDRKVIYLDESEHIIVHNTHEPIIDKKTFEKVQDILGSKCVKTSRYEEKLYPLSGMLKCAECGSPMHRSPKRAKNKTYVYYKCKGYLQKGTAICSYNHSIKEEVLFNTVMYSINMHIKSLIDINNAIRKINESKAKIKPSIDFSKLIKSKQAEIEKKKRCKRDSYYDWKNGDISKELFKDLNNGYDSDIERLNSEILSIEEEMSSELDIRNNNIKWLEDIIRNGYIDKLTRQITAVLIDYIIVDNSNKIKIIFNYKNEYQKLIDYMKKHSRGLQSTGESL